ncbi:CoA transferase [Oricola sp.]|uniref:CoA transferase n=1 Tax=Oricola sp. TaxID=1979950 RepID=UPI0025FF055F|nr:CoA transferase [Oricola sp.]MCI5078099.1 CoA transferase [Oricola sp.]
MTMLEGIRVVELTDRLVDFGGRMLAELGAEVVSIGSDNGTLAWQHGKQRLTDIDDDRLCSLIAEADILLDGRRKGTGPDVGDPTTANPRLVHVIARPFSADGPYAGRPATDLTLMALSGLMTVIGDPGKPPLRLPGEQAYALTGIQVATAALLGLRARRTTGKGQRIDVSAFQSATLANYREAIMYEWTGRIGHRTGNKLVRGKSGVRQVWRCADGYVTWSMIDNPGMMRSVVRIMAEEGVAGELTEIDWDNILVADTDQDTIERWQDIFARFYAAHNKAQLGEWSLKNGWGLSVIADLDEVRQSEHLAARGLFVPVTDEATGTETPLPGPLFRHGAGDAAPQRRLKQPVPIARFDGWSGS